MTPHDPRVGTRQRSAAPALSKLPRSPEACSREVFSPEPSIYAEPQVKENKFLAGGSFAPESGCETQDAGSSKAGGRDGPHALRPAGLTHRRLHPRRRSAQREAARLPRPPRPFEPLVLGSKGTAAAHKAAGHAHTAHSCLTRMGRPGASRLPAPVRGRRGFCWCSGQRLLTSLRTRPDQETKRRCSYCAAERADTPQERQGPATYICEREG